MNEAGEFASKKGIALGDRYEEALEDPKIEAVILATPHGLHEEQVLAAAAAGKEIFCEKPFALSSEAANKMIDACNEKGMVIGIGHERRFEPSHEELKRMLDEGELGTLLHMELNWSHNRFAGSPASGWRQDPKQAPAGTLTALGVHMTDYMQSLAGPVKEVFARTAHRSPDFPAEDVISIQFSFASGVTGYLCDVATTPFYQRISVFGDRGWAESIETTNVDVPQPAILTWRGMNMEIHTCTFKSTNSVRANLDSWAAAVVGEETYRFSNEEIFHNVQIIEAIVASASSGQPQNIQ